ncbi:MAG: eukaryotic-like serine/threonine-protein kinase [Bradyrhizobium sp.]|jgi:serine/threonine-protein kinase|nr:eukaryotic-like serine/threonine-protein kinase [Bradyrhizobium sp.]
MSQMRRIGQFELQELLGEGGIGQVYAACDTVLDRMVAIKSLRAELLSDKSFVARFRGEAKNLALLSHPNITTLYTLLEEGGSLYMVMELVRGRTLEEILDQRGAPFTTEEALAIIAQAADGLSYAHEMGIVHRDIKPANLILTNTGLLKIMDFGIARAQGTQRMTRDGSIVGTLAYMSPEQCRGQEVDGRTDQYSLAIVLYEMLTGKVPFEATTDYELMQAHINSPPEWPSRRVPGIAPHAEKALMKALSKKAHDRFPTLTAFKEALGAPASRTEALSIVHKVTRLAGSAGIPAISSAMSNVSDSVKKSSVPFAVKGIVAGGGLALVLAAGLLYLLSPRSTAQSNAPIAKAMTDGAPVQKIPLVQSTNPYFVGQQPPATAALPLPDTRQAQPPNSASTRPASGGRIPFEIAAAPQPPGPAAGNQPGGPSASNTASERITPAANDAPVQNSTGAASTASASTPNVTAVAADANSGSASGPASTASETTSQKVASTDPPDSAPKPARAQSDGRRAPEKDVLAAYEAKNYASARELAEPCAKEGSPDCQFILARLLETGSAGPKDPAAAADWYRKAADAGLAKARYNLGGLYYRGEGVLKDTRVAAEWYSKAASQNHAGAQFNLATLYETGDGVTKSVSEARRWYTEVVEKAADKQLAADAQEALDRLGSRRKR